MRIWHDHPPDAIRLRVEGAVDETGQENTAVSQGPLAFKDAQQRRESAHPDDTQPRITGIIKAHQNQRRVPQPPDDSTDQMSWPATQRQQLGQKKSTPAVF